MNSNGGSHGGGGGGAGGGQAGASSSSTVSDGVRGGGRGGDGDEGEAHKIPKPDSDQALFWAAVSGMTALNGKPGGPIDDDTTRGQSFKGSSSASPRSPAHSVESEMMIESAYRRGGGGGIDAVPRYDLDRARAIIGEQLDSPIQAGSTPSNGADSFCCKLASVLVSRPVPSPSSVAPPPARRPPMLRTYECGCATLYPPSPPLYCHAIQLTTRLYPP